MNAVSRQRRTNARRIAQATAAVRTPAGVGPKAAVASLPVGWLPLAAQDRADAVSGTPATIDLLGADQPAEHSLVALTACPAHGRAVLNDDATATYTSVPGFTGGDSFSYRYTDERGRAARVTVAVSVSRGGGPTSAHSGLAYAA